MYCKNCGSKLSVSANFCGKCGAKTDEVSSRIKARTLELGEEMKKRKLLIIIISVMIVAVIAMCILWDALHKVDLGDYIVVDVSGYNEYGDVVASVDYNKLCDKVLGKKPDKSDKEKYQNYVLNYLRIKEFVDIASNNISDLKNGDKISVGIYAEDASVFTDLGFSLKSTESIKTFVIGKDTEKLPELVEIDIFDHLGISFFGSNGQGYLTFSNHIGEVALPFKEENLLKISASNLSYAKFDIKLNFVSTEKTIYIEAKCNQVYYLKNGDTVKISISQSDIDDLMQYGIRITAMSKTYQVSGLTD